LTEPRSPRNDRSARPAHGSGRTRRHGRRTRGHRSARRAGVIPGGRDARHVGMRQRRGSTKEVLSIASPAVAAIPEAAPPMVRDDDAEHPSRPGPPFTPVHPHPREKSVSSAIGTSTPWSSRSVLAAGVHDRKSLLTTALGIVARANVAPRAPVAPRRLFAPSLTVEGQVGAEEARGAGSIVGFAGFAGVFRGSRVHGHERVLRLVQRH
jgi:hypothetical protein